MIHGHSTLLYLYNSFINNHNVLFATLSLAASVESCAVSCTGTGSSWYYLSPQVCENKERRDSLKQPPPSSHLYICPASREFFDRIEGLFVHLNSWS